MDFGDDGMGQEFSYKERIILFAKEKSLAKFEDKKLAFPDRMSMYSWYTFNERKILASSNKYCIIISKQKEDYIRHINKSIPLNQDVISYEEDIQKIEEKEKHMEDKKT